MYWNSNYTNEQGGHEIPLYGDFSQDAQHPEWGFSGTGESFQIERLDALSQADGYQNLYVFGYVVPALGYVPEGMQAVTIPGGEFAVFRAPAHQNRQELGDNLRATWRYACDEWLPASAYEADSSRMAFEYYLGSSAEVEEGFYIAVFDVDRITRPGMDAARDGVMKTVFLPEVTNDYLWQGTVRGRQVSHKWGCSGIDGTAFGPIPGEKGRGEYLFVAYGVYSDPERDDNDYQVLLCYDTKDWARYETVLDQNAMHKNGPAHPLHKFFVYTGNTSWGVQNLEYDAYSGNYLMAVYPGKKPGFANLPMYIVDGSVPPRTEILSGSDPACTGEVLTLLPSKLGGKTPGFSWPHGSTGLYSLGDGRFYVSHHGRTPAGHDTHVRLTDWAAITAAEIK